MAKVLQFRRGTAAANSAITGAEGELFVDLDTNTIRIHDGTTVGGIVLGDYNNLTNKPDLTQYDNVDFHANQAAFPGSGETYKIYVAEDTGYIYRWNGSGYSQIGGETPTWGSITGTLSAQTDLQNALDAKADTSSISAAGLSGSYNDLTNKPDLSVYDEVLPYANQAAFPASGETGKVYVAEDTGYIYRWSGSAYVQLTDQTAIWGQISGTLSSQTDLQSAINAAGADQTITLSGDVSGSGTTSISVSLSSNVVGADELNVSGNGTAGQALLSDGDGSFSWGDAGGGGEFTLSGSCGTIYGSEAGTGGTGTNNFFAGYCAGASNTSGCNNIFIGNNAGAASTTGSFNFFAGYCAGASNSGFANNFFGCLAGFSNTTGGGNNFFGKGAGICNTTGSANTFFGSDAGCKNTAGSHNTFFGFRAGVCNTTGCHNNFFGCIAGCSNITGSNNIFFGRSAGQRNTTGNSNIFLGLYSGWFNTTGSYNTFIGCNAGCSVVTGANNLIIGSIFGTSNLSNTVILAAGTCERLKVDDGGLYINGSAFSGGGGEFTLSASCGTIYSSEAGNGGTGTLNFFAGYCAGACNTTGTNNTFFGCCTGRSNTAGSSNTFFGRLTGFNNTTGSHNAFFGRYTGYANTTGSHNTFFGLNAGNNNTTGSYNTFIGFGAGCFNTTGTNNTFFGNKSGYYNTTGSYNIFFGRRAGYCNTTGSYNIFFGCNTGYYSIGCNNIFIGRAAGCCAIGLCNVTTQSNHIVMGNSSHTTALIKVGWTTISDCRDKCIFGPVPHGRGFLQNITPIEYAFKDRETGELKDPEGKRRYGFSAQNVLEAEGEDPVIVNADDLEHLKLTSDHVIPVLVNAVKELSEEVDALKARLDALENS